MEASHTRNEHYDGRIVRRKHPDYFKLYSRRIMDEIRAKLGGVCVVCGARDELHIDCIGRGADPHHGHAEGGKSRLAVLRRETEGGNTQLLCRWCDIQKTRRQNKAHAILSGLCNGRYYFFPLGEPGQGPGGSARELSGARVLPADRLVFESCEHKAMIRYWLSDAYPRIMLLCAICARMRYSEDARRIGASIKIDWWPRRLMNQKPNP